MAKYCVTYVFPKLNSRLKRERLQSEDEIKENVTSLRLSKNRICKVKSGKYTGISMIDLINNALKRTKDNLFSLIAS